MEVFVQLSVPFPCRGGWSADQLNVVVKDVDGGVRLTECPVSLQRWMVSGPT